MTVTVTQQTVEVTTTETGVTLTVSGAQGPQGSTGATGAAGQGVPTGGTAGQVLAKIDGTNYNTEWVDQTGGGGGAPTDASYLTLGTNGTLSDERVLTAGDNVTLTDAGAGSTLTVAVPSMPWADVTGAPTTLAGYGISDAQPLDSDLTAIAALTTTSFGRALLALADAAALRTAGGLGTAATADTGTTGGQVLTRTGADGLYQPLDSDLTAIAALTTTSYGRSLLEAANAAALRTLAGLGGAAVLNVGTTAGTVAAGDDSRLSDARTPTAHTHPSTDISDSGATGRDILSAANGTQLWDRIGLGTSAGYDIPPSGNADAGQVVFGTDTRLTNSRTPTAHASSHATAGSDPLSASDIGAAATSHTHAQSDVTSLTTDLAAKAPLASPTFTGTPAAPTAAGGTSTTQVATTAFVAGEVSTHSADTTSVHGIADTSALYRAGGTDVALADGGTGASLTDPNADRLMFWDDSAGAVTWLTPGTGLSITGTTLNATGGGALSDGDYGDITVGGAGTTLTIDNDVVTYAKMQNMSATDKVLGRSSSGAGDVEEITFTDFAQSLADDADAAAGRTTLGIAKELGYAAITSDLTTTSDSMTDATGLSVTVTVGSLPIIVEFMAAEIYNSVDQKRTVVELYDSTGAAAVMRGYTVNGVTGGAGNPMHIMARLTPSSGSRTYKVRWQRGDASGTSTMRAASTWPAFIRVYEVQT